MRKAHCLVSFVAVVAAVVVGGSAGAATGCLQLELSQPATVCSGQSTSISATLTNSCPVPDRLRASFTLDDQALRAKASFGISGDATITQQLSIPVPATALPGTHTLTVDLTDAGGDETSATLEMNVSSCTGQ